MRTKIMPIVSIIAFVIIAALIATVGLRELRPYMPFVIIPALVLLIDYYSFQALSTATRDLSVSTRRFWEIAFWSITAITFATIVLSLIARPVKIPIPLRYVYAVLFLIYISKVFLIIFLVLDDVVRLFRWIASFVTPQAATDGAHNISRLKFISQVGLAVAGFVLGTGLYGMIANAYNYRVHRVRIGLKNLPESFNGLKIVQLSDIHSGSFTRTQPLIDAVASINAENPDLIFFTGDLVNDRASEVEPYLDIFGKLKAKEGVYSTFGNHDYGDYAPEFQGKENRAAWNQNNTILQGHHKTMGWDLLNDENRILKRGEDSIAIIGIQNSSAKGFKTYGDLEKAYRGSEGSPVKLLLSHDPSYWDHMINKHYPDIDVTFAGHTHGAQLGIEIPGFRWSPSQYIYKQWAGLYKTAEQYIYVNRGFGFLGYPGRIGILPEITVVELFREA